MKKSIIYLSFAVLALGACTNAQQAKEQRTEQQAGTVYTCSMHPEVKQDHPGSCPKCNMDLVPQDSLK